MSGHAGRCGAATRSGGRCDRRIRRGRCPDHARTPRRPAPDGIPAATVAADPMSAAGRPRARPFTDADLAHDHGSRVAAAHSHAGPEEPAADWLKWWDAGREDAARYLGPDSRYVHFTDREGAEGILATGELWTSARILDTAFAQPVGGAYVAAVQTGTTSRTGFGRVEGGRELAVVFTAPAIPDGINPEEVFWKRADALRVTDVEIVDHATAKTLLDDSLGVPEPGL